MSQLVRLEGKHSTQNAHCALWGHRLPVKALALSARGLDNDLYLFTWSITFANIFYSILMYIFDKSANVFPSLKSTIPISKWMTIFVDGVYIFFTAISFFGIKCILYVFLYSLNAIFKKAWLRPKTHFGKSTSQFIRHTCYFRTWKGFNDILDVYRYVIFSPFEMNISECFFSSF